jgi:hypothetical protein
MNDTKSRYTPILYAALVGATSCASLGIPGLASVDGESAPNPLSGASLRWLRAPRAVPVDGPSACTLWPLDSTLSVHATAGELCLEGEVYSLQKEGALPQLESALAFQSDGTESSAFGAGKSKVLRTPQQKIGSCYDKITHTTSDVWVAQVKACTPNQDASGNPVLTRRSTFLEVGDARWRFTEANVPLVGPPSAPVRWTFDADGFASANAPFVATQPRFVVEDLVSHLVGSKLEMDGTTVVFTCTSGVLAAGLSPPGARAKGPWKFTFERRTTLGLGASGLHAGVEPAPRQRSLPEMWALKPGSDVSPDVPWPLLVITGEGASLDLDGSIDLPFRLTAPSRSPPPPSLQGL